MIFDSSNLTDNRRNDICVVFEVIHLKMMYMMSWLQQ